ncbi:MAG TPA: hypothetical protein VGL40_08640 [Bacillota bacterium]
MNLVLKKIKAKAHLDESLDMDNKEALGRVFAELSPAFSSVERLFGSVMYFSDLEFLAIDSDSIELSARNPKGCEVYTQRLLDLQGHILAAFGRPEGAKRFAIEHSYKLTLGVQPELSKAISANQDEDVKLEPQLMGGHFTHQSRNVGVVLAESGDDGYDVATFANIPANDITQVFPVLDSAALSLARFLARSHGLEVDGV